MIYYIFSRIKKKIVIILCFWIWELFWYDIEKIAIQKMKYMLYFDPLS